jgi:hypothetical protein
MWIVNTRRYAESSFPEYAGKGNTCSLVPSSGCLRPVLMGLIAGNLLLISAGAGAAKPVIIIPATRNAEHKISPYTRVNIERAEALKAAQSGAARIGQRQPRLAGQVQRY